MNKKINILFGSFVLVCMSFSFLMAETAVNKSDAVVEDTSTVVVAEPAPLYVRGVHVSMWVAGSPKLNKTLLDLVDETELNTMVIDIKEYDGKICIPAIKDAVDNQLYVSAIKDVKKYVASLKAKGIYVVARQVVFKDNSLPRKKPELGVKNPDGSLWVDRSGSTWFDPYNKDSWEYNITIAEKAVDLGFQEIQFDYIRFPSDGNMKNCRYSNKEHNAKAAAQAIVDFLKEANKRLKAKNAKISIDVFGLTTTATDDMGIGQKIIEMTQQVDYVSPMVYPSHYAKGEYGIADPNSEPYKTVYISLEGALRRLPKEKLRPFYQDFSLGVKYDAKKIRAQMQAGYDNDISSWMLWNPRCVYVKGALLGPEASDIYTKSDPETPEMIRTKAKIEAAKKKEEDAKKAKQEKEAAALKAKESGQEPQADQAVVKTAQSTADTTQVKAKNKTKSKSKDKSAPATTTTKTKNK